MTPLNYKPKTVPRAHQLRDFLRSADLNAYAHFHEPRTGKSKIVLDTAAYRFERGDIDALLVIAWPSGVHRNWVTDEIPAHLPQPLVNLEANPADWPKSDRGLSAAVVWRSSKAGNKGFKHRLELLLAFPGLAILTVNAEAIITERCREYLKRFMDKRRCLVCGDESDWFSAPGAQRSKLMYKGIGKHPNAVVRRIATATPTEDGPLGMWSQFMFLDPSIIGLTSYYAFQNYYAEWESKMNYGTGQPYRELKRNPDGSACYRNLAEFKRRTDPWSSRVLFREVSDSPPKVYQKRYFQLSDEQRKRYDQLRDEYRTELRDGREVTAALALTRYLRLQQIGSNRWPASLAAMICDKCDGAGCEICGDLGVVEKKIVSAQIDPTCNPRADALGLELTKTSKPEIIWCRFTEDVDDAIAVAEFAGRIVVRYDGTRSPEEKDEAKRLFQEGRAETLVGTPGTGGRGVKMSAVRTMIFYSNAFSLRQRLQAEDRGEDVDKTWATSIVDLVAEDTVDEIMVQALREKKSVNDVVLGDRGGVWL